MGLLHPRATAGDLAVIDRGEGLWSAADARRQPDLMGGPDAASRRRAADDTAAPEREFTVTIGERAGGLPCRVEVPGRLLRIWSLLQATQEQIDVVTVPPEGVPPLQRQLRAIRRELEDTISPALVTELRRIAPPSEDAPSAARLRIECAILTSWTGTLTMEMLNTIEAVGSHLSRQPAPASAQAGARPERTVSRNRAARDPGGQASTPLLHGLDAVSTSSGTTRRQARCLPGRYRFSRPPASRPRAPRPIARPGKPVCAGRPAHSADSTSLLPPMAPGRHGIPVRIDRPAARADATFTVTPHGRQPA